LITVDAAGKSGRDEALRLLYSRLPVAERGAQIASMKSAIARGEVTLDDLLVARLGGNAAGALLLLRRAGRMAFLWPPVCTPAAGAAAEEMGALLLRSAAERADRAGIQFTQALLDPADRAGRRLLQQHGFPERTTLSICERPLDGEMPAVAGALPAVDFAPERESRFAQTLERTLAGSLDCPIVSRLRSGNEALAAHRATGTFRASGWRLYQSGGRDAAILLVADFPESDSCEVAYLGVVPEERGQGWGRVLVRDALEIGRNWGRARIQVAVDGGNFPAQRVYRSCGFEHVSDMIVHLRLQNGAAAAR
jgi:GNAT superfamily N-acetyltransferase